MSSSDSESDNHIVINIYENKESYDNRKIECQKEEVINIRKKNVECCFWLGLLIFIAVVFTMMIVFLL